MQFFHKLESAKFRLCKYLGIDHEITDQEFKVFLRDCLKAKLSDEFKIKTLCSILGINHRTLYLWLKHFKLKKRSEI